jgi:hypothetical protein
MKQLDVDPGYIAEKFNPWQGQNTPMSSVPDDATKQVVIARIEQFKGLLKLAAHYSEQL